MPLNKKFQHQPSSIATYDWTDLASGKAYQTFYGGYALPAGYFLSTTPVNSGGQNAITHTGITTISTDIVSGYNKKIDIDFDTTFDTPQTIDGDCFTNCTVGLCGRSGTDVNGSAYIIVQALKNGVHLASGASVTQLMALNAGVSNPHSKEEAVKIVIPKTTFAIGDTLRFTTEVWATKSGGANEGRIGIGHDGSDRNEELTAGAAGKTIEDDQSTQLTFHVPFSTIDA